MKVFLKTLAIFVIAAASLLPFSLKVEAQTPTQNSIQPQFIQIGSTDAVMNAQVSIVTFYALYVQQVRDGHTHVFGIFETNRTFTSKQELDAYNSSIIPLWTPIILSYAGTNIDRDLPFQAYGHAVCRGYDLLYRNYQFSLVLGTNGQYQLPTFPNTVPMSLYPYWSAFYIPGIKSAIMEIWKPEGWSVVTDSRITGSRPWILNDDGTGGGVDVDKQFLILPPPYITGNCKLRLMVVYGTNNKFAVANESGFLVPETPTALMSPTIIGSTVTVTGSGGDPGRYLVIQSSFDFLNWTTVSSEHIVQAIGTDLGIFYSEPLAAKKLYRVKAIDKSF
jgi:hypothetical protein